MTWDDDGWGNAAREYREQRLASNGKAGPTFSRNNKFDVQLRLSQEREQELARIFTGAKIERFSTLELKTENYQWEQTGNLCVEYRQGNQPSGLAVTKAEFWVHELQRGNDTLVYLMFPVKRLKDLARVAYSQGRYHTKGGDSGQMCNILIPLSDILK